MHTTKNRMGDRWRDYEIGLGVVPRCQVGLFERGFMTVWEDKRRGFEQ